MQSQFYKRLIQGYIDKTLTKEELAVFIDLLGKGELDQFLSEDMELVIHKQLAQRNSAWMLRVAKYAAVLLLLGFSAFYLLRDSFEQPESVSVLPGYEHAVLRMADGTEVILDTNRTQTIETKSGVVLSNKDGKGLVYDLSKLDQKQNNTIANQYSSIEIPKGGTYSLILSDGTKVWLNAFSKLRFPMLFNGNTRMVEMEGEVYFEVAPNKLKPFIVRSRGQEIKVFGTIFNINAYQNEKSAKTTLIEGSVSVSTAQATKFIKPGEQASVNNNGIVISNVDVDHAVAWKEGYFKFDKLNVSDIMRQVERWYDVEVMYDDSFKDELFVGKIKRSANVSELIGIFNEGGLKVSLKDRKLYVSNNR